MTGREGPIAGSFAMLGRLPPYAVRTALFYAALFLVYGIHVPYLPVWLDWRGLNESEVAAITAAPFLLRLIVTPACAIFADRIANHRAVIIALAWTSLAAAALLSQAGGFWQIFAVAVPFAIAVATIMPLIETVAVQGVKAEGLDYGRMRLWGSLSFIGVGLIAGALIDRYGVSVSMPLLLIGCIANVAAAHALPRPVVRTSPEGSAVRSAILGPDLIKLVTSPLFIVFLIAASGTQAAHALFYTFGALHLREQGISGAWIGALWAIAVLSEVLVFAYAGSALRHIRPATLLVVAALAAVFRWLAMSFDPPLAALIPLQILHAATYGAAHLGAINYITTSVPESASGAAQALYATFAAGVVMGAATLASGSLYKDYAGDAYLAMAALAAVSLAASLYVANSYNSPITPTAAGPADR